MAAHNGKNDVPTNELGRPPEQKMVFIQKKAAHKGKEHAIPIFRFSLTVLNETNLLRSLRLDILISLYLILYSAVVLLFY